MLEGLPSLYLPRGNSPSSLRQRTVGVGSPWTSQKNSTVSSANTTWFTGCLVKTGLSEIRLLLRYDALDLVVANPNSLMQIGYFHIAHTNAYNADFFIKSESSEWLFTSQLKSISKHLQCERFMATKTKTSQTTDSVYGSINGSYGALAAVWKFLHSWIGKKVKKWIGERRTVS